MPANSELVTRLAVQCRVFQDQHPALGFLGGDQAAGFHDQRLDVVKVPDVRPTSCHRFLGDNELITFHSGAMSFLAIRS